MKIRYLGTAATEGFPAAFCNCKSCTAARKDISKELRTRSQMLIDTELMIDFPPESYYHAMRFGVDLSAVRTLLVTHSHTDHFYAQEFVNRGYKFAEGIASEFLDIYGNGEVLSVYEEGTRREMRNGVRSGIRIHCLHPFDRFAAGGYEIFVLPAHHTPKEEALLYGIRRGGKSLLYLNDTGAVSDESLRFLAENEFQADFISMDCTFADDTGPHSDRHMGFDDNEALREKLIKYRLISSNAKYYVTHFSHNSAPFRDRMEAEAERRGFHSAHDGLEIEI